MQTFSGNPLNVPHVTGEGVVTSSASLQGHEAIVAFPAMNKAGQIGSAAIIQSSVENVATGIAMQVRATPIEATENDAERSD